MILTIRYAIIES